MKMVVKSLNIIIIGCGIGKNPMPLSRTICSICQSEGASPVLSLAKEGGIDVVILERAPEILPVCGPTRFAEIKTISINSF